MDRILDASGSRPRYQEKQENGMMSKDKHVFFILSLQE
jgi:hypothetical protein